MMAAVTTAWGQQSFKASYKTFGPFTYDGEQHSGVQVNSTNCNDWQLTGDYRATNAGNYTCAITSFCSGSPIPSGLAYTMMYHVGSYSIDWTILPRDLSDGVKIEVKDQKWTGNEIEVSSVYTIKYKDRNLNAGDFNVVVTKLETPTTIKDEGRYVIVFTGKGNFKGQVVKTFDVRKDLSQREDITGVHYDIPEQIYLADQRSFKFQVEVSDRFSHAKLFPNEDYTMTFYDGDTEVEETAINAGDENALGKKYKVKFTGKAPKYDPETSIEKYFYVVKEYQTSDPTKTLPDNVRGKLKGMAKVNIRLTKPGYPIALDSPDGRVVLGEGEVAPKLETTGTGNDATTSFKPAAFMDGDEAIVTRVMVLDTIQVAIAAGELQDILNHNIVGIENNAFAGLTSLRWINSLIPGSAFTPVSLDRSVIDTPFYGIPRQTLVYLYGYNIKGENYIYKVTEQDFRSELFHIYEDIVGNQTKYSDQK